ncbi:hypothetical protein D9613_003482 [Agrocybe pediades]|uniref:Uncharacterized protein n=1 Tax=Agrocybe pediades TaxID=84607 RepID=A0A8H4QPN6_9AGAR|nr:hypothetical protein D9613_003482 [Agrocybe pediades]
MSESQVATTDTAALSKKSRRLQRDTFIFLGCNHGPLIAGLNQRVTKATPHQVDQWLRRILFPSMPQYILKEVTLESWALFLYAKNPTGKTIEWDDKETAIPAGYYALFNSGGNICFYVLEYKILLTLQSLTKTDPNGITSTSHFHESCQRDSYGLRATRVESKIAHKRHPHNTFDECKKDNAPDKKIWETVLRRDKGQCALSGPAGDDAVISWIVPPAWMEYDDYDDKYKDPDDVRIPRNCITMHKSLQTAFMNNSFAIDVDDNYRIVLFEEIGKDALQLLAKEGFRASRLKEHILLGGENTVEQCFIKAHFKYSLCSKFSGGDASNDYTLWDMEDIVELGSKVSPNHPFWNSVGGQDLLTLAGQAYKHRRCNYVDDQDEEVQEVMRRLMLCEQEEVL